MPNQIAEEMSDTEDPSAIPPLTRNGYTRLPETEADIRASLHLSSAALVAAFSEAQEGYEGYRKTEALIFFIRRAHRMGDKRALEGLFGHLIKRCQAYFRSAIRGFDQDARQDIQNDIIAATARLLIDPSDAADFLESLFWVYLERKTKTARGLANRRRFRAPLIGDMSADEGDEGDLLAAQQHEQFFALQDAEKVRDGLAILPADLRELLVLRFFEGWQIGNERSKGTRPSVPTLADKYQCSTKTIHNRLAKAKDLLLAYWKDDQ